MVKRISLASNGKKFISPPRDKKFFFLSFFACVLCKENRGSGRLGADL